LCWWLTLVILGIQEAEIRRISVQSQPLQIVHETLSQNRGWWSGLQCRPEFKPRTEKKKINKREYVKKKTQLRNSVVFRIFIILYNDNLYLVSKFSHPLNKILEPLSFLPYSVATTNFCFCGLVYSGYFI
jgi:hypothetical protein